MITIFLEKTRIHMLFFCLLISTVFSGCALGSVSAKPSGVSPTLTQTETSTSIVPSPTVAITQTPTITPVTQTFVVRIERTLPEEIDWEGSLLVYDIDKGQFYFLTLPQLVEYPIQGNRPWFGGYPLFSISSDRSTLAYIDTTTEGEKKLNIVKGDRSEHVVHNWPNQKGWDIINWLDNHRISLAHWDHRDGTVYIYDTSSGDLEELIPFFPAVTSEGELLGSGFTPARFVYYNPSLTHLVVVRYVWEDVSKTTHELWDVNSQAILWNKTGFFGSDNRPLWSPDGKKFVVGLTSYTSKNEGIDYCADLFLINTMGEQTLLDSCIWGSSSWSPDGDIIATWKDSNETACPPSESSIGLLLTNVKTGEKDSYTICLGESENGVSVRQYPIWSLDGRFIAFNLYNVDLVAVEAVILDLTNKTASVLPEINEALGWVRFE